MNPIFESTSRNVEHPAFEWLTKSLPEGIATELCFRAETDIDLPEDPRERRQREFRWCRESAQRLLSSFEETGEVEKGLDRAPIWPAGFAGSISHSPSQVWTIVAPTTKFRSVGIDTEMVVRPETRHLLIEEILKPQEEGRLRHLAVDLQTQFTIAFSAKEAFYKCWYGINRKFFNFRDAEIVDVSDLALSIRCRATNPNFGCRPEVLEVQYFVNESDVFTATWMEK